MFICCCCWSLNCPNLFQLSCLFFFPHLGRNPRGPPPDGDPRGVLELKARKPSRSLSLPPPASLAKGFSNFSPSAMLQNKDRVGQHISLQLSRIIARSLRISTNLHSYQFIHSFILAVVIFVHQVAQSHLLRLFASLLLHLTSTFQRVFALLVRANLASGKHYF